MKPFPGFLWLFAAALPVLAALAATAAAQSFPVTPTTPTQFDRKPTGSTAEAGATVAPTARRKEVIHITYLTLSDLRDWTSAGGKSLKGKLIAWEQTENTTALPVPPARASTPASPAAATRQAPAPPVTDKPTVVKGDKIRLLIGQKAHEVPLTRLDENSRKYVLDLQARLQQRP